MLLDCISIAWYVMIVRFCFTMGLGCKLLPHSMFFLSQICYNIVFSELFCFSDQVSPLLTGKQFPMIPSITKSGLETMLVPMRETGAMTGLVMLTGQETLRGGGKMW